MKASTLFWPVLVAGLTLLLGSLYMFHYPIFGLIIFAVILVVFVGTAWRYRGWLLEAEQRITWLRSASQGADWDASTAPQDIQRRVEWIEAAVARGEDLRRLDFSDLLGTREGARSGTSASASLIVLGLLATFYGLVNVVETAGGATSGQSLELPKVLALIFSNLQGIFGSSLSGLAASLLLGVLQGVWSAKQAELMAEVEEFHRFCLLPKYLVPTEAGQGVIDELRQLRLAFREELVLPTRGLLSDAQTEQRELLKSQGEQLGKILSEAVLGLAQAAEADRQERRLELQKAQIQALEIENQRTLAWQSGLDQWAERWREQAESARAAIELQSSEILRSMSVAVQSGVEAHTAALASAQAEFAHQWNLAQSSALEGLGAAQSQMLAEHRELSTALGAGLQSTQDQLAVSLQDSLGILRSGVQEALREQNEALTTPIEALRQAVGSVQLGLTEALPELGKHLAQTQEILGERVAGSVQELHTGLLAAVESQKSALGEPIEALRASVSAVEETIRVGLPLLGESTLEGGKRLEEQVGRVLEQQASASLALTEVQEAWAVTVREIAQDWAKQWDVLRSEGLEGLAQTLRSAAQGSRDGLEQVAAGLEHFHGRLGQSLDLQDRLSNGWNEAIEELRLHQIELQASMEHFRAGVEFMVERFGREESEQESLAERQLAWEKALMAYQDRVADLLHDNALRSREILQDVLSARGEGRS